MCSLQQSWLPITRGVVVALRCRLGRAEDTSNLFTGCHGRLSRCTTPAAVLFCLQRHSEHKTAIENDRGVEYGKLIRGSYASRIGSAEDSERL
jgi:hypothetical protein